RSHGPQDFGGAEVPAVLARDDLADLLDGVVAAADDHRFAGDRFGLDALHRFQHAALGELEGEAGDDAAHVTSQREGKNGPTRSRMFQRERAGMSGALPCSSTTGTGETNKPWVGVRRAGLPLNQ